MSGNKVGPRLYLGLDLSTQQLKGVVIDEQLQTIAEEAISFNPFDTDNFLRSARARKKRYISLSLAFYYHDHMLSKLSRIADISIV
jgi:hypothetical protein